MARTRKKESGRSLIGAGDARARFSELLDRAEAGESITITRRGAPIARLGPVPAARDVRPPEDIRAEFRAFQNAHPLVGVTTRELINEGRGM